MARPKLLHPANSRAAPHGVSCGATKGRETCSETPILYMRQLPRRERHSYRTDAAVPPFPDDRSITSLSGIIGYRGWLKAKRLEPSRLARVAWRLVFDPDALHCAP